MRTFLMVLGMVLFLSCAVLILAGWRNPSSKFLNGFVQTRHPESKDPGRTAAAACWLLLGLAAGSVGLLVSLDPDEPLSEASLHNPPGYLCALLLFVCLAIAVWVRLGDAPQSARPAAMRSSADD